LGINLLSNCSQNSHFLDKISLVSLMSK